MMYLLLPQGRTRISALQSSIAGASEFALQWVGMALNSPRRDHVSQS